MALANAVEHIGQPLATGQLHLLVGLTAQDPGGLGAHGLVPLEIAHAEDDVRDALRLAHIREPRILRREDRDKRRSYLALYRPQEKKFVRLADATVAEVSLTPRSRFAIGTDEAPYERMADILESYIRLMLEHDHWKKSNSPQPGCRRKAREAGKTVEVVDYLVDGALAVLMQEKNREKHNALVLAAIRQAESECDVIVLAQGSMAALLPELAGIRKPVLTSPRLAVERAREMLRA